MIVSSLLVNPFVISVSYSAIYIFSLSTTQADQQLQARIANMSFAGTALRTIRLSCVKAIIFINLNVAGIAGNS